ncbi:TM2 domain-containing protein [Motilimonas pumila]|uniref:TM2 domain-containing protein n=1 Tax=Motilimonas pumila TaxID=2303987 RepID=A0A418YBF2_9GAMM|nr:TM2 domain-containing protein [Motilimonas pumila]RJG40308.1 TM2 domain-containing protein [Motilimonas pumila]
MKGQILEFDESSRSGTISGEDGSRYTLAVDDWKGNALPKTGQKVDFNAEGDKAQAVYLDTVSGSTSSKKIAAALFAFFLGAFGAHKFYLGYTKQGVIMLLTFIFGFILLGIPSMVIGVIAFIEFILYLVKSDEEFEQTYVQGEKGWF